MSKIGIIRCDVYSENCAGFHCFPAVQNRTGQFQYYDNVELIGFDTCGGCGRGKATKIVAIAKLSPPTGRFSTYMTTALNVASFRVLGLSEMFFTRLPIPMELGFIFHLGIRS